MQPHDLALDFKMEAIILPCVDLSRRKNNRVQVFKTMQGVCGGIRPFNIIVFVASCYEIFVLASFVFCLRLNLPFSY